jgi:NADH-ubiquinone oxidoreductase chain 5
LYAFVHLLSHAIFKSLLFILIGLLIRLGRGDQDLRKVSYYGHFKYVVVGIFICLSSLRALFFLGGILRKDLFLEFYLEERFFSLLRLALIVEILITFFYSYKVAKRIITFGNLIKIGFSLSFFVVLLLFGPFLFYLVRFFLQNYLIEGSYNNFRFWTWVFFLSFYLFINIIYLVVSFLDKRSFIANFFFLEVLSIFYRYLNLEITTLSLNLNLLELLFGISGFKEVINSKFIYLLLLILII